MWKRAAVFTVLRHWRLVPFIMNDVQFGVSCFCLHGLLYRIASLVMYSFSFTFLCWYICPCLLGNVGLTNSHTIYLNCHTFGQTNCSLKQRYEEHIRYIKQQDPQFAYAVHVLNNNHEYGPINTTMSLLKQITKTTPLIPHEQFYIWSHYYKELAPEQNTGESNPLY
jgi:hypothetical protein